MHNTKALRLLAPLIALLVVATLLVFAQWPGDPALAQTSAPANPTGLTVSSKTHDSAVLSWNDPGDDSITGYVILRRDPVNQDPGIFTTVDSNTGNKSTTYTDVNLDADKRYVYRIQAINSAGTSGRSNYVNVTTDAEAATPPPTPEPTSTPETTPEPSATPEPDTDVPEAPTGLTASVSFYLVILTWNDPEASSITGYRVMRHNKDTDQSGVFTDLSASTGTGALTYADSTAEPGKRYIYQVRALSTDGESPPSNLLDVDTPGVPAMPAGLTTGPVSHDSITITWNDPEDDSITGYKVLRRSRDGDEYGDGQGAAAFKAIEQNTGSQATSYTDTSVEARTRYVYRIKARNPAGLGPRSTYLNVETEQLSPPSAPTGLTEFLVFWDWATIQWDDPEDSTITHYQVLRRVGSSGEFTTIEEDTESATTQYTDNSVSGNTEYEYRLVAVNAGGASEQSASLSLRTWPAAIVTETVEEEELETAQHQGADGHRDDPDPVLLDTVWSATMTVGVSTQTFSNRRATYTGFIHTGVPATGALSNRSLRYEQEDYQVTSIHHDHSLRISDNRDSYSIVLEADKTLPESFTLLADGTTYSLADSLTTVGTNTWVTDEPTTWTDGQIMPVELQAPVRRSYSTKPFTARLTADGVWSDKYHTFINGTYHATEDWFLVNLQSGQEYRFTIEADDPHVRGAPKINAIFDTWGLRLSSHGQTSVTLTAWQNGDYLVHVDGAPFTGFAAHYRLRVELVS